MTSIRALLSAVLFPVVVVALLLSAPAGAQLNVPEVTVPTVHGVTIPSVSTIGLDGTVAAAAESGRNRGPAAKESASLSALAVVMLVIIVAVTAVVGSRKSSR